MTIGDADKARFIELIRSGDDRGTAAYKINPEYTGTMFRRLCSPTSKNYDAVFAEAYDRAVEERGPLDEHREQVVSTTRDSSPVTPLGFTRANHLSDEQLAHFIDAVRNGTQSATAAKELEPPTSITQIHRRAARDPDFAERFRLAKDEGVAAYKDNLRAEAARQAFAGDYRALRDQMLIHLDEARQALTTNRHEISGLDGGAIRLLAERHFAELPPEMLEELITTLERRELGGPVDG